MRPPSAHYPETSACPDPEVAETAAVMADMLKLHHYPAEKALQALVLAARRIESASDSIEALRTKAELRGVGVARGLIEAEGGQLSGEEVGERTAMTRETVNQWRRQGRILGWRRGVRNYSYPAWQIYRGALLPGLAAVLNALAPRRLTALETTDFILSESGELGGRPLDLLRKGAVETVVEHAKRYGDIGA